MTKHKERIIKLRKQEKTYKEIGDILGISKQRVHQIYKDYDSHVEESRNKEREYERKMRKKRVYYLKCHCCNKNFYSIYQNLFCSRDCLIKFSNKHIKDDAPRRDYGSLGKRKVYKRVWYDDSSRYLHRVKMEKHLGRKLKSNEHVHHKDGNGLNNNMDNLELIDGESHRKQTFKPITNLEPNIISVEKLKPTKYKILSKKVDIKYSK